MQTFLIGRPRQKTPNGKKNARFRKHIRFNRKEYFTEDEQKMLSNLTPRSKTGKKKIYTCIYI